MRLRPIITVRRAIVLVALLCAPHARLAALDEDPPEVEFCLDDGSYHICSLADAVVLRGPDWTPGGKPAPLRAEKAVQIASSQLSAILKGRDVKKWQVVSITTKAFQGTDFRKWYYEIDFIYPRSPEYRKKHPDDASGIAVIFVNMDGTPGQTY